MIHDIWFFHFWVIMKYLSQTMKDLFLGSFYLDSASHGNLSLRWKLGLPHKMSSFYCCFIKGALWNTLSDMCMYLLWGWYFRKHESATNILSGLFSRNRGGWVGGPPNQGGWWNGLEGGVRLSRWNIMMVWNGKKLRTAGFWKRLNTSEWLKKDRANWFYRTNWLGWMKWDRLG